MGFARFRTRVNSSVRLRQTVRTFLTRSPAIAVVLGGTVLAYQAASPKVLLVNHSDGGFYELVVSVPSNRLSFGPIAP